MTDLEFLALWGLALAALVVWMYRDRKTADQRALPPSHVVITHELRPIPYVPRGQPVPSWITDPEGESERQRQTYCPVCLLKQPEWEEGRLSMPADREPMLCDDHVRSLPLYYPIPPREIAKVITAFYNFGRKA